VTAVNAHGSHHNSTIAAMGKIGVSPPVNANYCYKE